MLSGKWPFGSQQKDERMIFREIRRGKYTTPDHLSEGAKHLMGRLLTVSADKRMTMEELKSDPWFSQGYLEVNAPAATPQEIASISIY